MLLSELLFVRFEFYRHWTLMSDFTRFSQSNKDILIVLSNETNLLTLAHAKLSNRNAMLN